MSIMKNATAFPASTPKSFWLAMRMVLPNSEMSGVLPARSNLNEGCSGVIELLSCFIFGKFLFRESSPNCRGIASASARSHSPAKAMEVFVDHQPEVIDLLWFINALGNVSAGAGAIAITHANGRAAGRFLSVRAIAELNAPILRVENKYGVIRTCALETCNPFPCATIHRHIHGSCCCVFHW